MDSYAASPEMLDSPAKKLSWEKVQRAISQNVFFTMVGHEFKLASQARVQKIWFYLSLFYGILMVLTVQDILAIQSGLTFFVNFGTIFAFIPASSSISGEIGGIADTILSKSVRRWQYVISKHIAHILITILTYVIILGGMMGILAIMKKFDSSIKYGYLTLIIGLDALILCVFTSLGVTLSSFFTKPIFPILGSFLVWFGLIFLFILIPTLAWDYSPVIINNHFSEIIQNDWKIKYWKFFVATGSIIIVNWVSSMIAFYRLDF